MCAIKQLSGRGGIKHAAGGGRLLSNRGVSSMMRSAGELKRRMPKRGVERLMQRLRSEIAKGGDPKNN